MLKIQLKPLVTCLCLVGFMAVPVYAETVAEDTNTGMEQVSTPVQASEADAIAPKASHRTKHRHQRKQIKAHRKHTPAQRVSATQETPKANESQFTSEAIEQQSYLPFDLDVPGQAFVSTGPYVGVPIQFSGSDLIINSPSVNTDVQLLNLRKSIIKHLDAMGGKIVKEPYHSHLLLSGIIESQANYTDIGGKPSTTDIDVTNVSLDALMLGPSDWLTGFIELTYQNSAASNSAYRVANSRIFVNKAFVTIGDFEQSPLYATVGQFYVPFGTYSSVMLSDPFTKILGRTKARSILVGYQQQADNAFYGAAYIFRGDSHAASVSKINNGGINAGYKFDQGSVKGNVGGGVIANIADSAGMQLGTGFGAAEQLVHRVPAYNLRGIFSLGTHIDIIAEYVTASTRFSPNDMTYNGHGAKPWALDTEIAYSFSIAEKLPSSIGLGYGKSAQALALGIPSNRYSAVFNTSIWRNTLQSLEFHHDRNYGASKTANGPIGAGAGCVAASCTSMGKSDNMVTAQFDYYF